MKPRRASLRLLWAALVLAVPQHALAQSGPIVIGAKEKRPFFQLSNTIASLEFLYRREESEIKPKNGLTDSFLENRFEETFTLETTGYIYHPNLVELNLAGTFGLKQDSIDDNGDKDTRNGTITEYDLSATILRKEVAPVTLYTR